MHVEVLRDGLIDRDEEVFELDRAMAGVQLADHLPGCEVQRGVKAHGAVALVVVAGALRGPGEQKDAARLSLPPAQ